MTLSSQFSRLLLRYYFGPDHPFKLRLWSYLMAVLGHPRFTVPYFGGWISLDPRDWIQNQILIHGVFDPDVWEAIDSVATRGEILWDVGAHVGTVSVRAIADPRFAEVHAFEPQPQTFSALQTNLELNVGKGKAHCLALSNEAGPKEIYDGLDGNTGLASFTARWGTQKLTIECETADRMVSQNGLRPPTIMKIDTEGAEAWVLEGARAILKNTPPKLIVFEAEAIDGKIRESHLAEMLVQFGYEVVPIHHNSEPAEKGKVVCHNWRAIHRAISASA